MSLHIIWLWGGLLHGVEVELRTGAWYSDSVANPPCCVFVILGGALHCRDLHCVCVVDFVFCLVRSFRHQIGGVVAMLGFCS